MDFCNRKCSRKKMCVCDKEPIAVCCFCDILLHERRLRSHSISKIVNGPSSLVGSLFFGRKSVDISINDLKTIWIKKVFTLQASSHLFIKKMYFFKKKIPIPIISFNCIVPVYISSPNHKRWKMQN